MSVRLSCWRARRDMPERYLALTGDRMNAADAIYCGFADIHIAAAKLAELPSALADCRTAGEVRDRLVAMSVAPSPGRLQSGTALDR